MNGLVRLAVASILCGCTGAALGVEARDLPSTRSSSGSAIEAQALDAALTTLSKQTGLHIVYATEIAQGKKSLGTPAGLSAEQMLQRVLEGTGLTYKWLDAQTVVVRSVLAMHVVEGRENDAADGPSMRAPGGKSDATLPARENIQEPSDDGVQQIVVTGTHIRGTTQPVGSHVITIDEDEIRRAGYSNVQDVVRSLPQSFNGGTSEDTFEAGGSRTNEGKGTALDLRGLGAGSTLVLINGRRVAASGSEGYFTDVSSIPLTAVERIEVLPDGASALYGSDAVGGVVNIILKTRYDGSTTQARAGSVTSGSTRNYLFGQNIGTSWDSGSVIVAGEYFKQDPLAAEDRSEMRSDLTSIGGADLRLTQCNPGNLVVDGVSYAIPSGQDGAGLDAGALTPGTTNRCDRNQGTNILSEQQRWNVFGTLRQNLANGIEFFVDASHSERKVEYGRPSSTINLSVPSTNAFYVNPTGGSDNVTVRYSLYDDLLSDSKLDEKINTFGSGISAALGPQWRVVGQIGVSKQTQDSAIPVNPDPTLLEFYLAQSDPAVAFNPFGDGSHTSAATIAALSGSQVQRLNIESELSYANVTFDGPLSDLPGGAMKLAVGADYREQSVKTDNTTILRSDSVPSVLHYVDFDRDIKAMFGELLIPIIGARNARPAIKALELSLAGRYEDYNDFGSTTVPRIGIRWMPVENLSFRSTWSESFKAPGAADMSEAFAASFMADLTAPNGVDNAIVLIRQGGNPDLKAETAKVWTGGLDWTLPTRNASSVSLTYFNIEFTDRIIRNGSFDLADPTISALLTANPTAEQRQGACTAGIGFEGNFSSAPGDCLTAAVDYLLDSRALNTASVKESGLDLMGTYTLPTAFGDVEFGVNAAYVFAYDVKQTQSAPEFDVVDTASNPLAFKARGSVGWSRGGFNTSAYLNYADKYRYSVTDPRTVGAWTTVDLSAGYDFGVSNDSWLKNTQITLNAQNLFDEGPPAYANPSGVAYDRANADLLRRFVSVNLRKSW